MSAHFSVAKRPAVALLALLLAASAAAGVKFTVTLDRSAAKQPLSGRLLVMLVRARATQSSPLDGPNFEDPQPMFGIDARGLAPGASLTVDDAATSFPTAPSQLEPGSYRAAARLDLVRRNSNWRRDAGNLYSDEVTVRVERGAEQIVALTLAHATEIDTEPEVQGVELFAVRSALLSSFWQRDVLLRAGVVFPLEHDAARSYPAVYEVPGYGDDHRAAYRRARRSAAAPAGTPAHTLARNTFWIVLDPESANGHTLFANSDNNGPCGDALVRELIPALEAKYGLSARPAARLLRGHSSGGWSSVWLALNYPDTFGAAWASSPDPVDFRRFQLVDIYAAANMYTSHAGTTTTPAADDIASYRQSGKTRMTIRQENAMEQVVGPDNTSAQQWDSWQAVFGPRNANGHPAALYDPLTGAIDHAIAEQYRRFDVAALLRAAPQKYGPVLKQRVRILVGDQDSFYLDGAVKLLKQELDQLELAPSPGGEHGSIEVLPGFDHGSIFMAPQLQNIPAEMWQHLQREQR